MRGLFEFDDVVSNSIGGLLGCVIYQIYTKIFGVKIGSILIYATEMFCIIMCLVVCIQTGRDSDPSPQKYCFQIDSVSNDNGNLVLSGFAFLFNGDAPPEESEIVLMDTQSKIRQPLVVESGILREDVNDYFECEYNYTKSGFNAVGEGIISLIELLGSVLKHELN